MTVGDIRDVKFYVLDESADAAHQTMRPLDFDIALSQAQALAGSGRNVHVMYTDGASRSQLAEFARNGIPATLVSSG